jgi:hypothetical protein
MDTPAVDQTCSASFERLSSPERILEIFLHRSDEYYRSPKPFDHPVSLLVM